MKWLVIDGNNLVWRKFHAYKSRTTTASSENSMDVTEMFLRDILFLNELHAPDGFAFCFDKGRQKRQEIFPDYKKPRQMKFLTTNEIKEKLKVGRQIEHLCEILPAMGFVNVFSEEGYEADDLIASTCQTAEVCKLDVLIVSTDKDLYQLLRPGPYIEVSQWNGKRIVTAQSFRAEYGISASEWLWVKTVVGDPGDAIPGIKGVGEISAIKYLKGRLPEKSYHRKQINSDEGVTIRERNLPLMRLPFPGTPKIELIDRMPTEKSWDDIINKYKLNPNLLGRGRELWQSKKQTTLRGRSKS